MAGGVVNPAPCVVEPVRTGRVHPTEVAVHPGQGGDDGYAEAAHGQEGSGGKKEEGGKWEPYGAGEEDEWGEEDDGEGGGCDGEAGEDEQDGAGDEEGQEADELGGVWCMVLDFTEECGSLGWG